VSVGHPGEFCKTDERIEMSFRQQTRVGQRNRVGLSDGLYIGATWRIQWIALCGSGDDVAVSPSRVGQRNLVLHYTGFSSLTKEGVFRGVQERPSPSAPGSNFPPSPPLPLALEVGTVPSLLPLSCPSLPSFLPFLLLEVCPFRSS